jgi:hypothetical protein
MQHPSRRKLFVRSLNYATTNESLGAEFAKYGELEEGKRMISCVASMCEREGSVAVAHS